LKAHKQRYQGGHTVVRPIFNKGGENMYDLRQIMTNAHIARRKAIKIAAGKKIQNLITKKWEHPKIPPFGEFLRESWRQARKE